MKPTPETQRLYEAVLSLRSEEECAAFLDDLLTIRERFAMAQRLAVAERLRRKKNYLDVSAETGASSVTICRVARCLNGGEGGYRIILDRLAERGGEKTDGEKPTE